MGQVSARTDGRRRGGGRGASERRNERMSAKLGAPFQDGKLWEAVRGGRYLVRWSLKCVLSYLLTSPEDLARN